MTGASVYDSCVNKRFSFRDVFSAGGKLIFLALFLKNVTNLSVGLCIDELKWCMYYSFGGQFAGNITGNS